MPSDECQRPGLPTTPNLRSRTNAKRRWPPAAYHPRSQTNANSAAATCDPCSSQGRGGILLAVMQAARTRANQPLVFLAQEPMQTSGGPKPLVILAHKRMLTPGVHQPLVILWRQPPKQVPMAWGTSASQSFLQNACRQPLATSHLSSSHQTNANICNAVATCDPCSSWGIEV